MKRRSRNSLKERSLSVKSVRFVNASKSSHHPVEDRQNGYKCPGTYNESHSRSCYSILTDDYENSIRNVSSKLKKNYGDDNNILKQVQRNNLTSSESYHDSDCKHKENGQSSGIYHKPSLHSDPAKYGQCPDSSCDSGRENQCDSQNAAVLEPQSRPTTTSRMLKRAEADVEETGPSVERERPVIDSKDLSQSQSQNQVSKTGYDSSQKAEVESLSRACTLKNSGVCSQSASTSTRQNKPSVYSQLTSMKQDKLSELKKVCDAFTSSLSMFPQ